MIEVGVWDANDPASRERRRQSIGASEVAAVLGLGRYGSPLSVWLAKTQDGPDVEDNDSMKIGRAVESLVVAALSQRAAP